MRKRRGVLLAVAVGVPLLAAGAAYGAYYHDRALPGTSVAGRSVEGLTRAQVADRVSARAKGVTLTLQAGKGSRSGHLADFGYHVDVDGTVGRVFDANSSWTSYVAALVSGRDVAPQVSATTSSPTVGLDDLVAASGQGGAEPAVTLAADHATFTVTAPVTGKTVRPADYRDAVEAAGRALASRTVRLPLVTDTPHVTPQQAQQVADAANALVAHTVSVSDGKTATAATAADKASWVVVTASDGAPASPHVDPAKVGEWVSRVADATGTAVVNGVRTVDSEGNVMSVAVRAKDGRAATNASQVTADVVAALRAGTDYTGTLTYDTVAATWTNQPVGGSGSQVYAAADGEKWIDVNLTTHTITAYEGSAVVRGPIAMVNGAKDTPTVVGTFHIYSKVQLKTMRGNNADGTPYVTPDVPWVSYFYSGYALHGAPWRSHFGYTGSHGCINLPVPVAKWVYAWAPVGTTVVTHR